MAMVGKEIKGKELMIKTDKPNVKVSWQVTGIRYDALANKNRIPEEENKIGDKNGKYTPTVLANRPYMVKNKVILKD